MEHAHKQRETTGKILKVSKMDDSTVKSPFVSGSANDWKMTESCLTAFTIFFNLRCSFWSKAKIVDIEWLHNINESMSNTIVNFDLVFAPDRWNPASKKNDEW